MSPKIQRRLRKLNMVLFNSMVNASRVFTFTARMRVGIFKKVLTWM